MAGWQSCGLPQESSNTVPFKNRTCFWLLSAHKCLNVGCFWPFLWHLMGNDKFQFHTSHSSCKQLWWPARTCCLWRNSQKNRSNVTWVCQMEVLHSLFHILKGSHWKGLQKGRYLKVSDWIYQPLFNPIRAAPWCLHCVKVKSLHLQT